MKLSVEKKDFLNMIARAQTIVEKRNTMPILINVLLEAQGESLRAFATDLEVSSTDEIKARLTSPGKVAVSAKSLFEIIKEMPEGPIELERQENNWLKISQNRSVFNIVGISPEEYPVFPPFTTQEFMTVESDILAEMIEKTIYAVSNDETRYHLNGVYFEISPAENGQQLFRMVATDGHRLSAIDRQIDTPAKAQQGVIVPRKGLQEVRKLVESVEGPVEIAIEGT